MDVVMAVIFCDFMCDFTKYNKSGRICQVDFTLMNGDEQRWFGINTKEFSRRRRLRKYSPDVNVGAGYFE
jgi:hypothetical protein